MTIQSLPQHKDPTPDDRRALAPYNFVPLPEQMVEAQTPLDHDKYYSEGVTGWIECQLETCSPTFIRGMMTTEVYQELGNKKASELTEEDKEKRAPFFHVIKQDQPVIPGSSLRGMIRQLVEMISYGRVRYVAPSPTFTFRAVADKGDDPLKAVYKNVFGSNAGRVKAGYLETHDGEWYIRPGQTQAQIGWNRKSQEQYIKVYDEDITNLPGFIHLRDKNYRPQVHPISFERGVEKKKTDWGGKGKETRPTIQIGTKTQYRFVGTLVCVGDMNENRRAKKQGSQVGQEETTPRKKHIIVLPPNHQVESLPIPQQVIQDYRAGLSPFQKEELGAWADDNWGCLGEGKPVFYIQNDDKTIRYLGHNLNFRIPVSLKGASRAATPRDFVPAHLRENPNPDFADAIFGWVEEKEWTETTGHDGKTTKTKKVIGPTGQRSGRVFFSDAHFQKSNSTIWFRPSPITPHILSGPKPTTFQHYLVQDSTKGHNPDQKNSLAHYGTSPKETVIRGYKLYWHKGATPDIEATQEEKEHLTQLTRIKPLNIGCQFTFKIYFENLRPEELGALCWALTLPAHNDKIYRHKLGMGKPIGMGSIALTVKNLHTTDRTQRYQALLDQEQWCRANCEESMKEYISQFETYMLQKLGVEQGSFANLGRITALLTMFEWFEKSETTRYMQIEHPSKGNEYKERPVLPTPQAVASNLQPAKPPQPLWPQPGEKVAGVVHRIDNMGVHLALTNFPVNELQGFISKSDQKKYKLKSKGISLDCEVVAIRKGDKKIDCRPIPKSTPK